MDADAAEVGHSEQDGQPLLEFWRIGDDHGVAAFRDGRAAFDLVAAVGVVAPCWFEGVAEIQTLPRLDFKPTYRVGLAFLLFLSILIP